MLEGSKRQGITATDIIVCAAYRLAEGKHRHALIESKNLSPLVAPELRRDQAKEGGFASAGRTENQGVADITNM